MAPDRNSAFLSILSGIVKYLHAKSLSRVLLFATLWTVAFQAPLSMGILQAKILKWVAMPSYGDLPESGIRPASLMSPALAGGFFTTSAAATYLGIFV